MTQTSDPRMGNSPRGADDMRLTRADYAGLHIHAPQPIKTELRVLRCSKCKKRRRCDVRHYEWYEPSVQCRTCKRKWVLSWD